MKNDRERNFLKHYLLSALPLWFKSLYFICQMQSKIGLKNVVRVMSPLSFLNYRYLLGYKIPHFFFIKTKNKSRYIISLKTHYKSTTQFVTCQKYFYSLDFSTFCRIVHVVSFECTNKNKKKKSWVFSVRFSHNNVIVFCSQNETYEIFTNYLN